jgi:predicted TIM-barrel enzyme
VRTTLPDCPLLVGSGAKAATVAGLLGVADGCIVGTSLQAVNPATGRRVVDTARARAFAAAAAERKD